MSLRKLVCTSRRRTAWLALVATTLLACSCLAPDGADLFDASAPAPTDDAGSPGPADAGTGPSTADSGPVSVQPACASATTALVPASPAGSGDLNLACGGTFGSTFLENCFCPASSPECPDPIYGIPGVWNPLGAGCGFCMNAGSILCGTVVGTPYSCGSGTSCVTLDVDGDAGAGYACCPVGETCSSLCSGVCVPGTTQCADGGVQTCGNGDTWGPAASCTGQACVNGACAGVCTPGPSGCADGGVATCNANGEWDFAPCVDSYCQAGKCLHSCVTGSAQCANGELQTCGAQGTWEDPVPCQGQACEDGGCVGVCTPGSVGCSGNAPATCNAVGEWDAGAACPPAAECNGGTCVCPNTALMLCGSACVDLQTDSANCGSCGATCSASGQTCGWGFCQCPGGEIVCGGACLDAESDPNDCGTCGTVCSATGQSCVAGACTCATGSVVCNGACLNVQADPNNCGDCGVTCAGTCTAGRCLSTLISGRDAPQGIVVDGNYLAWVEPGAGNVMELLTDGGGARAIATNQDLPTSIADYYGTVYWTNTSGGEIMTATVTGGAPTSFSTNQMTPTTVTADPFGASWIVNGNAVAEQYYTGNQGVLAQYSGEALSGLATAGSFEIFCDEGEVTWTDGPGSIPINPTDLGVAEPPCAFSIPDVYSSDYVVWTSSLSTNAVFAWQSSANDVGGGPAPSVIATGPATQTRAAITQDGVSAYWTNSDGTIMKVALTGGSSPVTLATGQGTPGGITIDSTSVYWTNSSAGTVMKLTPR